MLDTVPERTRSVDPLARDVAIVAIGTAVPGNAVSQDEMRERARKAYPQFAHIDTLYANTGIKQRYVCEARDWYLAPHTWEERTEVFQRHALDLMERAARAAVDEAGIAFEDIGALVVNTITGLAVPSLDAKLMNRLPFAPHVERLPIFGFGCGGGVAGLARASRLARTMPGGAVMFVTVDLCSLCLRINDPSMPMFVAGALFGDGAVAVILRNTEGSGDDGASLPRIGATGDHLWRETEAIMGWDVKNDGFGIVLSVQLPALMEQRFGPAADAFLARNGLTRADIDGYLLHPGGGKILDVADRVLGLAPDALRPSRDTLRDFGNMSSATAMFVLKNARDSGRRGRHLLAAFGPGFSAYFAIVDL